VDKIVAARRSYEESAGTVVAINPAGERLPGPIKIFLPKNTLIAAVAKIVEEYSLERSLEDRIPSTIAFKLWQHTRSDRRYLVEEQVPAKLSAIGDSPAACARMAIRLPMDRHILSRNGDLGKAAGCAMSIRLRFEHNLTVTARFRRGLNWSQIGVPVFPNWTCFYKFTSGE
jgi:hypothetical protein